ncbi:MAG TPA: Hsp20/alpha crystallin family protein [Nitrospiria bacterium]|nr:Hsp20/alpha crystallin family protein [Nitrospiria bacterium]
MVEEKIKVTEGPGALTPWRPWTDLSRMERAMERMADDLFGRHWFDFNWPDRLRLRELEWREPAIEITEEKDELVIKAEIPGIKKEDVQVNLSDHLLTIRGEKKQEREVKEKGYFYSERAYGSFCRSIELPTDVQAGKVHASFKDGLLEVRLPKTEQAKQREIAIKVE